MESDSAVHCLFFFLLELGIFNDSFKANVGSCCISRGSMKHPRIWLLLGHKQGDNHQVLALIDALSVPAKSIQLSYEPYEILTNLLLRKTTLGLKRSVRYNFSQPWPDLIITAGRRNEPVARWIRAQATEMGQKTKIVHLGRPWAHPRHFDLVVTTPQYQVPPSHHVVNNLLPLHQLSEAKLSAAKKNWSQTLSALPKPIYTLLIGGSIGQHRLRVSHVRLLAAMANDMAAKAGGSLCITTSARTPSYAADILAEIIKVPHHKFLWHLDDLSNNPYLGYLAYGDEFIVTQDSISMLAEVCFTGRPVHIFNAVYFKDAMIRDSAARFFDKPSMQAITMLSRRLAMQLVPERMRRNINAVQHRLIAEGRAVWLGEHFAAHTRPPINDMSRTTAAVQSLLDDIKNEQSL